MNPQVIGKALLELADLAASVAGDFHTLHLNMRGGEFDTMHKKVLLKYYEKADDDYDTLAEWAGCYGVDMPNKNDSAKRVGYKSLEAKPFVRDEAVQLAQERLDGICEAYAAFHSSVSKVGDALSIAVTSDIETLLTYWTKEANYFNKRRVG